MATVDSFAKKLDDKRRLSIPTEVRGEFASGAVITRGFDGERYLHLYSRTVWDQEMEPRLQGDILSKEVADLNVQFRLGKVESDLDDSQGRLTLSKQLLDYAGITKEVQAVRVGRYWRISAT